MSSKVEENVRFLLQRLPKLCQICKTQLTQLDETRLELEQLLPELIVKVDSIRKKIADVDGQADDDVTRLWAALEVIEHDHDQSSPWLELKLLACQALFYTLAGLSLSLHIATQADPKALLVSVKDEMTLRLATSRVVKWTFQPILSHHLQVNDLLFPIGDKSDVVEIEPNQDEPDLEQMFQLLKPFYNVLLAIHNFNCNHRMNVVGEMIRRDYYPLLLVFYAIERNKRRASNSKPCELEQHFERSNFSWSNQMFVIRDLLLLLTKCRPNASLSRFFNKMLAVHFTQTNGLQLLLNSILDSEVTSEKETTISHRLEAIVNVVMELPVANRESYMTKLLSQVVSNLLPMEQLDAKLIALGNAPHLVDVYWRMGAMLVAAIQAKHPAMLDSIIFTSMWATIQTGTSVTIENIEKTMLMLHRLLLSHVCMERIAPMFAPLFFIGHFLDSQKSAVETRVLVNNVLVEMLQEVPQSIHLLHDCLHDEDKWAKWTNRWTLRLEDCGDSIQHKLAVRSNQHQGQDPEDKSENLAKFAMKILERMGESYCYDYFFTLLTQLTETQRPGRVTLEMMELLSARLFGATISKQQEESKENVLLGCKRTVRFLAVTFERMVNRLMQLEDVQPQDEDELESHAQDISLFLDTLTMCLQILKILIDKVKQEELGDEKQDRDEVFTLGAILVELKPCHTSLGILRQSKQVGEWIKMTNEALGEGGKNVVAHLDDLHLEMDQLYSQQRIATLMDKVGDNNNQEMNGYRTLLTQLKHPLMPVRAHALIELRTLVYAHHPQVEQEFELLSECLQSCLSDAESYVYLAAINTLAALAIAKTSDVLPLLLREFGGTTRPLAVRLKTGEVILRLVRSLAEMAYHYSPLLIDSLMVGVSRSTEPAIQISSLSLLGELCARFGCGLSKHMVELMRMAQRLLRTSTTQLEVKRSVAVFLSLLLKGVMSRETATQIGPHLKDIKQAIIFGQQSTIDPVLQKHCQLAYAQLDRIAREILLEGVFH